VADLGDIDDPRIIINRQNFARRMPVSKNKLRAEWQENKLGYSPVMGPIARAKGQVVFRGRRGDQGVGHAQAGGKSIFFHVDDGSVTGVLGQGQCPEAELHNEPLDQTRLTLVTGALQEFHERDDGDLAVPGLIDEPGGLRAAAKHPNEDVRVKEHRTGLRAVS
jgi:hypothetical protein